MANKKGVFLEPVAKVTVEETERWITVSSATTVNRYSVERRKERGVQ